MVAPLIMSACFRLLLGMAMRQVAARACRAATWVLSRCSVSESASAAASRVRSSSVGPRPPMRMMMSGRTGAGGLYQGFSAVRHNGFECHHDANLVKLLSQIKRVGVLPVWGEHLRADGDDFRFHKSSF